MRLIYIIIFLSLSLDIFTQVSTPISFTNSGTGYILSGNTVTINIDGTYDLTGSVIDKQIIVSSSCTLNFNSFSLINSGSLTPLIINANKKVKLFLKGESTLQDSSTNNNLGIIYLQNGATLTIAGTGTLTLNPNKSFAIYGLANTSLIVNDGANINISSTSTNIGGIHLGNSIKFNNAVFTNYCQKGRNNTMYAQGEIKIIKGNYNIISGRGKAIETKGNLYLGEENGNDTDLNINIDTHNDGIKAMKMKIYSGNFNINTGEDSINIDSENNVCNEDLRCSGNCPCSLLIKKGNLTLTSKGDGINANGDITLSGGNIIIIAYGDNISKPFVHDGLLTINGGNVIAAGASRKTRIIATRTQKAKIFRGSIKPGTNVEIIDKNSNNKIMKLTIPKVVQNIYFNFPQDFIVKLNNVKISKSKKSNSKNNNYKDYDDDYYYDDYYYDDYYDDYYYDDYYYDDYYYDFYDDYYDDYGGRRRHQTGRHLKLLKALLVLIIISI